MYSVAMATMNRPINIFRTVLQIYNKILKICFHLDLSLHLPKYFVIRICVFELRSFKCSANQKPYAVTMATIAKLYDIALLLSKGIHGGVGLVMSKHIQMCLQSIEAVFERITLFVTFHGNPQLSITGVL